MSEVEGRESHLWIDRVPFSWVTSNSLAAILLNRSQPWWAGALWSWKTACSQVPLCTSAVFSGKFCCLRIRPMVKPVSIPNLLIRRQKDAVLWSGGPFPFPWTIGVGQLMLEQTRLCCTSNACSVQFFSYCRRPGASKWAWIPQNYGCFKALAPIGAQVRDR